MSYELKQRNPTKHRSRRLTRRARAPPGEEEQSLLGGSGSGGPDVVPVLRILSVVLFVGALTAAIIALVFSVMAYNDSRGSGSGDTTSTNGTLARAGSGAAGCTDAVCDSLDPFCPECSCNVTCGEIGELSLPLPYDEPQDPMPGCKSLTGRVTLVIGASRGIGLSVMQEFAEAGATVYGCGRSSEVNDEFGDLPAGPYAWTYGQCDVTNETSLTAFVDFVVANATGAIDMVVYGAGVLGFGRPTNMADEPLREMMGPQYDGLLRAQRIIRPHMVGELDTRFLVLTSIESIILNPGAAMFSASSRGRSWHTTATEGAYTLSYDGNGEPGTDEPQFINVFAGLTKTVRGNVYRGSTVVDFDPNLLDSQTNNSKCLQAFAPDQLTATAPAIARQIRLAACNPFVYREYLALGGETLFPGTDILYRDLVALFVAGPLALRTSVQQQFLQAQADATAELVGIASGFGLGPTLLDCCVCAASDQTGACSSVSRVGTCIATFGCYTPGPVVDFCSYGAPIEVEEEERKRALAFVATPVAVAARTNGYMGLRTRATQLQALMQEFRDWVGTVPRQTPGPGATSAPLIGMLSS